MRVEHRINPRLAVSGALLLVLPVLAASGGRFAPTADGHAASSDAGRAHLPLLMARAKSDALDPGDIDPLGGFFGLAVHDVDIEVDEAGVAALRAEPRNYVHGDVTIDGRTYADVGVRLKGSAGSFIALDGDYPESGDGNGRPGKSAFIVDFNRFVKGQSHLGLKKLTLNNMVQDPSGIHELVGYTLFRANGVPASRMSYGDVRLNGEPKGLYALIETPDNTGFLKRWFGSDEGNLYEGAYAADLRHEQVRRFDQDHGDDESKRDLYALVRALDAVEGEDGIVAFLEAHFGLDAYLDFAATEIYLGHWDGYVSSANNYALYHDLAGDRWSFLPWGIDQLFVDELGPYFGVIRSPGQAWHEGPGRVHGMCLSSPACRQRLHERFVALLHRVEAIDLRHVARRARAVAEPRLIEEAREFGEPELTLAALERVSEYIDRRADQLETWLPCLRGQAVDNDRDGFDGCSADCDDWNPAVHPGATEACNLVDDDCNGIIDDPDHCPKCIETEGDEGGTYLLCFDERPWTAARQHCRDEGGDLASLHDEETAERLVFELLERTGISRAWIGLSDSRREGAFVWSDGSDLDFTRWQSGAPAHGEEGDRRDCVRAAPEGWRDSECEQPRAFLCGIGARPR